MHTLYMHIYILLNSRMYSTKPRAEGGADDRADTEIGMGLLGGVFRRTVK